MSFSSTNRRRSTTSTTPTKMSVVHTSALHSVSHQVLLSARSINAHYLASIGSFGKFLYDKTKLKPEDLPRNYGELLDPKWKGKLVLTYPNDDDAIGYLFSLIIGRYGWTWFEALKKQDVQWVRGTATPGYVIAESADPSKTGGRARPKEYVSDNGQRILSFTTAGYPLQSDVLAWSDPDQPEQYMSWTQTIGIMKGTSRPETAKLFLAWITSVEFQTMLSSGSTAPTILKSVNRKNGVASLDDSETTQLNGFRVSQLVPVVRRSTDPMFDSRCMTWTDARQIGGACSMSRS